MPLPRRAREERGRTSGGRGGSGSGGEAPPLWLRTVPDMEHVPEDYGDVLDEHGVAPATYQALERYLPSTIRAAPREQKLAVMLHVLVGEDPAVLRARQRQRDYMEAIQSAYQQMLQYSQTLGQAILYRGRHRHGAHVITSGHKATLQMWCRSSLARRMLKYQTDFTSWCGKCQSEN